MGGPRLGRSPTAPLLRGQVAAILASERHLTSADLSFLAISDAGALAALCSLPALTSLNLEGCPLCTDAGLVALSRSLPRLVFANVCGCNVDANLGDLTERGEAPAAATSRLAREGGGDAANGARETPQLLTPRSTPQYAIGPRSIAGSARFVVNSASRE